MNAIQADDTRIIETPPLDTPTVLQDPLNGPPPVTNKPSQSGEPKSSWRKVAAFSVVALLAGGGIGFGMGIPGKNTITDQRNTARAEATQLTAELNSAKATLTAAKSEATQAQSALEANQKLLTKANEDLTTTKTDLTAVTATRDACATALTAGEDLLAQQKNLLVDFWTWLDAKPGSAAEATMIAHLDEQTSKMDAQQVAFDRLTTTCKQG